MRCYDAGETKLSPSPLGRGLGGGARRQRVTFLVYATVSSCAGGTPPPSPLPKGEGENLP
jgi:hypothetical protein